jgi:hypothetical protein
VRVSPDGELLRRANAFGDEPAADEPGEL